MAASPTQLQMIMVTLGKISHLFLLDHLTHWQSSGGLQDTGSSEGGCRDPNKGQIYTRGAWYKGRFGIMYAYYFPKDAPISGNVAGGHRHDWENLVVWIDNPANANPRILGAAASAHGKYEKSANPPRVGNSIKVEYYTRFPLNHALQFTETPGRSYYLSDWNAMGATERNALTQASFGAANVPFKDDSFLNNLASAWV